MKTNTNQRYPDKDLKECMVSMEYYAKNQTSGGIFDWCSKNSKMPYIPTPTLLGN